MPKVETWLHQDFNHQTLGYNPRVRFESQPAPIPVLCGPTASGKTALSLELAARFPLEVISADAMMVYRGMDVGTAKPSLEEQARVPHHLLDLLEPSDSFSVAQWVALAENAIAAIIARGRIPFVVGGTGFYIRSLSEGMPTTPASDAERISALEVELAERGLDAMIAELETANPADAARAERNPRRVLRSLEVLRTTGHTPSAFPMTAPKYQFAKVALIPDRAVLEQRIEARTKTMLDAGLIEEARALLPIFTREGRRATSFQAIGYKQALDHLTGVFMPDGTRRDVPLPEVERRINLATRQYAKRQETWFKAEPRVQIATTLEQAQTLLDPIMKRWPPSG